jgi:indole-3-glycerol phosphate synthase
MGMTPVVEVQNQSELTRALTLSPQVILINNRNLDTFEVSLATTSALAPNIPDDVVIVSASGFSERAEIESMLPFCQNFLIGSSLMTAVDLSAKLCQLKGLKLTPSQASGSKGKDGGERL